MMRFRLGLITSEMLVLNSRMTRIPPEAVMMCMGSCNLEHRDTKYDVMLMFGQIESSTSGY